MSRTEVIKFMAQTETREKLIKAKSCQPLIETLDIEKVLLAWNVFF